VVGKLKGFDWIRKGPNSFFKNLTFQTNYWPLNQLLGPALDY